MRSSFLGWSHFRTENRSPLFLKNALVLERPEPVVVGDVEQGRAQGRARLRAIDVGEALLCGRPERMGLAILGLALRGQHHIALTAVLLALDELQETIALQWAQVVTERRTVDDQRIGEDSHGRRLVRPRIKLRQDRELRGPQAGTFHRVVIELREPARGLAHGSGETGALPPSRCGLRVHGVAP